jgi:tetratricopeptide (TPR) repeat protein
MTSGGPESGSPGEIEVASLRASAERWARVRELLEAALDHEPASRATFVAEGSAGDNTLRDEVLRLLRNLEDSPAFLETPVVGAHQAREDPMIGLAVGPWKLLRRIGTGGTSSVYAAARTDGQFRKLVAVKIISPGMDAEEILNRFRTERQILAGLDHPNITRLLDGGCTSAGAPFIVMEYVEGVPVTQYANTRGLSVKERLILFRTLCSAVEYAHRNLVIHRDLKPANVLVTADGVPKLLDFGIARLLLPESSGFSSLLTRTNLRMMTPEYASPEQIAGEPITTASDVYSLGVILYELLVQRGPYRLRTNSPGEVENAIRQCEPERPSAAAASGTAFTSGEPTPDKLARRLRGDLDAIILTALRKEPARRYATVDRFSNDISRYLSGLPVAASHDTFRYRVGKFVRRNRAAVAVAAFVALVLVVATFASVSFARRALRQKQATLRLADIILGNLDAAAAAGPTKARRDLLDKILVSLSGVAPNTEKDPELRSLLFRTYRKLGDLQGNIYENNLGSPAAAKRSYERALALAGNPAEVAQASLGLGDVAFQGGDLHAALKRYLSAEPLLEGSVGSNPQLEDIWLDLTRARYKIGLMHGELGNLNEEADAYSRELQAANRWAAALPDSPSARRELALAEEHAGDALRQTGRMPEGLAHLQRSLAAYRDFRRASPDSPVFRHDEALASLLVAEAFRSIGELQNAEYHYRASLKLLDGLIADDPLNEQYRIERVSALDPLAKVLHDLNRRAESRSVTEEALVTARALADRSDASPYDLSEYCWILLTTPFTEFHRPVEALRMMRRAVGRMPGSDPVALNTLALAYAENGDMRGAVQSERQALAQFHPPSLAQAPGSKAAHIDAWKTICGAE